MMRLLIATTAIAAIVAQECPPIPDGGCNVCAEGTCVQDADAIFEFAGQPPVPCGLLESSGFGGVIPLTECGFLPGIINTICDCGVPAVMAPPTPPPVDPPTAPPVDPTMAPVPATPMTDAPVPVPPATDPPVPVPATDPPSPAVGPGCPAISPTGCNICPDGTCVQNADAIFMFPEQPTVACGTLEAAGIGGSIPLESCPFLPEITGVCECGVPGVAPPTPAPAAGIPGGTTPTPFPIFVFTPSPGSIPVGGGGAGGSMSGMGMSKMSMMGSMETGVSMAMSGGMSKSRRLHQQRKVARASVRGGQ